METITPQVGGSDPATDAALDKAQCLAEALTIGTAAYNVLRSASRPQVAYTAIVSAIFTLARDADHDPIQLTDHIMRHMRRTIERMAELEAAEAAKLTPDPEQCALSCCEDAPPDGPAVP